MCGALFKYVALQDQGGLKFVAFLVALQNREQVITQI